MEHSEPQKILVVEDEGVVALDLRQTLESLGYEVSGVASSGESALTQVESVRPDLALVDIRLGGKMDGIETAAGLRDRWGVPVIFLTGHASEEILERAKRTEPVGFVIKPYDSRNLHTAIEIGLYKHEAEVRKFEAAREVRESKQWLATTLSCISDAVVTVDQHGRLQFLNPAAERLFGVRHALLQGKPLDAIASISSLVAPVDHTRSELSRPSITEASYRVGEEVHTLEREIATLTKEDGNIVGTVYVFRDVTERRRAEQEKAALEEQLFQAQKMEAIGQLAGGIAHDFNNLLTAIIGNLSLLKERCPPSMIERLDATEQACSRAADLVGKLLTFSRTNEGAPTAIAVGPIVREAVEITRITFDPRIDVTMEIEDDLPLVEADPNQIHQLILNLSINARDAMHAHLRTAPTSEARLTVRVSLAQTPLSTHTQTYAEGAGFLCIAVRDTGTGMAEETKNRMFEPFFTTKKIGEGTGLGLSVVYGIVKKYRGAIQVRTELGKGTEIETFLPISRGIAPTAVSPKASLPATRGHETILVVDDEFLVRDIVRAMLEELGYKVYAASGGQEGLKTFQAHQDEISLVLSDLSMPDMDGAALFEKIRELRTGVRFLLSSGYPAGGGASQGTPSTLDVLEKPYKLHELARRIRDALEREP